MFNCMWKDKDSLMIFLEGFQELEFLSVQLRILTNRLIRFSRFANLLFVYFEQYDILLYFTKKTEDKNSFL